MRVIFVIIPSVPSLPVNNCDKLYPVTFLIVLAPVVINSPVGVTNSNPRTYSFATPYFTALGPPQHSAIFPPIKQLPLEAGSTG